MTGNTSFAVDLTVRPSGSAEVRVCAKTKTKKTA